MKCSFCGCETLDIVKGPDTCICHACIREAGNTVEKGSNERCNFCNQVIGTEKGFIRKRTIQPALIGNGAVICTDCIKIAKEVAQHSK
jgi:hypothetical protein